MDKGKLVPDNVVIGMISSKLDKNVKSNGFIFDSFQEQLSGNGIDSLLNKKNTSISTMVSLNVDDKVN